MRPAIEGKSLKKAFTANGGEATVHALQGVDLSIRSGEFVAVMGPSGCGKSTLLHLLAGLDAPTSGEVYLDGKRVDRLNETQWAILRRRQIGFVFQVFNLIGNLTVADNVEMPALLAQLSPKEAQRRRQTLLDELGLADKAKAIPNQLSGGQQQRVALARALINRPTILFADEPTGNLDSQSASEVLALLQRQRQQGQTILMVTHDVRVASIAGRVIYMRDGLILNETELTASERPREILSHLMQLEM